MNHLQILASYNNYQYFVILVLSTHLTLPHFPPLHPEYFKANPRHHISDLITFKCLIIILKIRASFLNNIIIP